MENIESATVKQTERKNFSLSRFLIIMLMLLAFLLLGFYTGTRYGIEKATEAAIEFLEYKASDPTETDTSLIESEPATVYGDVAAPTIVKVFVDMQCPSCSMFMEESLKKLIGNGSYRLEFFDLPSESHSYARLVAAYTRCAAAQGVDYLTYAGNLNSDFSAWTSMLKESNVSEYLLQTSLKCGADEDEMNLCVIGEEVYENIDANIADAGAIGVSGTPSFIIGKHLISGYVSPGTFTAMLKEFGN